MLEISRNYFALEAADSIRKEVGRSMQFPRTDQTLDRYIAEYDLLRRKAESEVEMGSGTPGQFAPTLCIQSAGPSRQEKSLALASSQGGLKFVDLEANRRRLFGSCGGAVRQDLPVTGAVDGSLGGYRDQEACVTNKKAQRQGAIQKTRDGASEGSGGKVRGAGRTLTWRNHRSVLRNCRHKCDR